MLIEVLTNKLKYDIIKEKKEMIDTSEYRNYKISIIVGEKMVDYYEGPAYIYFADKEGDNKNTFHFIDSNKKHHRIINTPTIVKEI